MASRTARGNQSRPPATLFVGQRCSRAQQPCVRRGNKSCAQLDQLCKKRRSNTKPTGPFTSPRPISPRLFCASQNSSFSGKEAEPCDWQGWGGTHTERWILRSKTPAGFLCHREWVRPACEQSREPAYWISSHVRARKGARAVRESTQNIFTICVSWFRRLFCVTPALKIQHCIMNAAQSNRFSTPRSGRGRGDGDGERREEEGRSVVRSRVRRTRESLRGAAPGRLDQLPLRAVHELRR